jgi:hypothetical protein
MSRQRTASKVAPHVGNDRSHLWSDDECVQKLAALIDTGTTAISARSHGLLAAIPFPWSNVGRPYRTAKQSCILQTSQATRDSASRLVHPDRMRSGGTSVAAMAMKRGKSVDFAGYWQRHVAGSLSYDRGISFAMLGCWGFEGPAREIPTPPSDHTPLRRRCAFRVPINRD